MTFVVATCLWAQNKNTNPLSGTYKEHWVERLYRGAKRQFTVPFRFVCFVDKPRKFAEPIEQERLSTETPDYGSFTEPYRLNEPMILVGLDTIFVRNCDHLARWCMDEGDRLALPTDPKSFRLKDKGYPYQAINGVALVPRGWRRVWDEWDGKLNDMQHIRKFPWVALEDRFPGQIKSYKMHLRAFDPAPPPEPICIVYFHGMPKPDTLRHLPWVEKHWQ